MADDDYTTGAIEPEWSKRFNASDLKEKVKTILDGKLKDFNYNHQDFGGNSQFSNGLAAEVRNIIQKGGTMKRYKLNVQIFLGEKRNQRVTIVGKAWWDDYVDNYISYTYQGEYFYCTCIVWGFYTD